MKSNEVSLNDMLKLDSKEIYLKNQNINLKKTNSIMKSEINFQIELDDNRVPEKLSWTALEGGVENQEAKAIMFVYLE